MMITQVPDVSPHHRLAYTCITAKPWRLVFRPDFYFYAASSGRVYSKSL